jgi:hypothetical protein
VTARIMQGMAAAPRPLLANRRRHPASPVIGPGSGGIAVRGEQVEERADPKPFLGGVPEQVVAVHKVAGAAAGPGAGDVAPRASARCSRCHQPARRAGGRGRAARGSRDAGGPLMTSPALPGAAAVPGSSSCGLGHRSSAPDRLSVADGDAPLMAARPGTHRAHPDPALLPAPLALVHGGRSLDRCHRCGGQY